MYSGARYSLFFLLGVLFMLKSFGYMRPAVIRTAIITSNKAAKETKLNMGLFDFMKPKKSASASHILVKGPEGSQFLSQLKSKLSASKNVPQAFAEAAAQYSSCPSGKRGGSLGNFQQGQMVPAFDKVVFGDDYAVGEIHGPVNTPFGAHLILIESRES